jgi:hypothetical protein
MEENKQDQGHHARFLIQPVTGMPSGFLLETASDVKTLLYSLPRLPVASVSMSTPGSSGARLSWPTFAQLHGLSVR